jgi:hypothetical protein
MANTITNVTPKLLAMGLMALRENAILPQLVNKSYGALAQQRGNVINVPIPSAITARSVTPALLYATNVDSAPTVANVTLDRWMEAPFQLSDNDLVSVMDGVIPMQASEAIKALGNDIDTYILGKHTGIFSATGVAGTTPFNTSLTAAANARKLLNKTLAPVNDRYGVVDPDAEGNFLLNTQILQAEQRGDQGGIVNGLIGTKLGIQWHMDQNLTANTFTPGTAAVVSSWTFDGSNAAGATTAAVVFTGSGTIKVGDIFALTAGGLGYVITAAATMATGVTQAIAFYPGLRTAVATGSALVVSDNVSGVTAYVPNLVFHRDAFAFASRPLQDIQGLGNSISTAVDPVTGIALRLEVSRQYKQTTFSYDILYGANLIRPELAAKIRG